MNWKLSTWLAVAVAGAAFDAGCGSSSSTTSSSQTSSTPAASTPVTPASTARTPSTGSAATGTASTPASTTSAGGASGLAVQQIVAQCQSVIHRAPTLSASVKAKVEGICSKAASGDL